MKRCREVGIHTVSVKTFPPAFAKRERVFVPSANEFGVVKRVLPPNKWSGGRHRYLIWFIHEYGGEKHATKFQYGERELRKISQRR